MFGKKAPSKKRFDPNEWLHKTDLQDFFSREAVYELIEVKEEGDFPRSFRFKYKLFEQTLTVASLIGNDYDVDRAWLMAAFPRDPAVDLSFVNHFNNRRGLACASIDENGASVVHAHFPLCGLKKRDAELMLAVHIGGFENELAELNRLRNDRAR
jgi:hypothetical protein